MRALAADRDLEFVARREARAALRRELADLHAQCKRLRATDSID